MTPLTWPDVAGLAVLCGFSFSAIYLLVRGLR